MDYTKSTLLFKIRKVFRYLNMYGFSRTLIKIKGQYHKKRKFSVLPDRISSFSSRKPLVAVIGCGNFAYSNIVYYLISSIHRSHIVCMDVDIHKAASLFKDYKLLSYTDSLDDILLASSIELVYISSNHASHSAYAVKCLDAGKHVHIEKPHVVSIEDLDNLSAAIQRNPSSQVFWDSTGLKVSCLTLDSLSFA